MISRMLGYVACGVLLGGVVALCFGGNPGIYAPVMFMAFIIAGAVFVTVEVERTKVEGTYGKHRDPNTIRTVDVAKPHRDTAWSSIKPLVTGQKVLAVALVVAGAVGALVPISGQITRTATAAVTGNWAEFNMQTSSTQQRAIDELIELIGTSEFTHISFGDDELVWVVAPTFPGADTVDRYNWSEAGGAVRVGPYGSQPDDLEAALFDVSQFDFSRVAAIVEKATKESGLETFNDRYVSVSKGIVHEAADEAYISVSLHHDYGSISLDYSFDGELLDKSE